MMTSSKLPNNELGAPSPKPDTAANRQASEDRTEQPPAQTRPELSAQSGGLDTTRRDAEAASSSPSAINSLSAAEKPPSRVATPDSMTSAADERAEILKRIAAFRKLQIKMRQDREKYYDETLARTRSLLSEPIKPRRR